jgi:hypothetical protein
MPKLQAVNKRQKRRNLVIQRRFDVLLKPVVQKPISRLQSPVSVRPTRPWISQMNNHNTTFPRPVVYQPPYKQRKTRQKMFLIDFDQNILSGCHDTLLVGPPLMASLDQVATDSFQKPCISFFRQLYRGRIYALWWL